LAVTDCLNFGNPYKPDNFWQLREAVEGVAEACRAFGTPVTGGNVSLYNGSPLGVVDPTPTIAMVGLIDDEKHITTQWFKDAGDVVILVGAVAGIGDAGAGVKDPGYNLGGSRYLKVCHGLKIGPPPHVDLAHEINVQNAVRDLIREGLVQSAHDCSEGGLAVALAESCFNPERLFGAEIEVAHASGLRVDEHRKRDACATLFNESQSRIVISVRPENLDNAIAMLRERDVSFDQLGRVGGEELQIRIDEQIFRWRVAEIYDEWWNAIRRAVEQDESIPCL
jgi:phosphoribosylformylglycinamidine synthase subunit PurL